MEGFRGFAVFLVFLVHYVSLVEPWTPRGSDTVLLAAALHSIGNSGVDLFFVLSGFLIYGSLLGRKQEYKEFLYRRAKRIYPAFTAVFLLYVLLSFAFPRESKIPSGIVEAVVYLLQNFFLLPGLFPINPMITVAWSLSYEMFYYLVVPVAIEGFRLRSRNSFQRTTLFVTVAVVVAAYSSIYGGHVRLIMFISGILLFEAIKLGEKVPKLPAAIGLFALSLGLLGTLLPMSGSTGSAIKVIILFIAFFTFCFSCFQDPSSWLARSFCWTPLRWLGNMSYSYYLLHGLALKAAFLVLPILLPPTVQNNSLLFWMLVPFMFAFTLIPTAALFVIVERPYSLSQADSRTTTVLPAPSDA